MLGFFPDPYPDELLYSVCARFHDLVGYSSWRATVSQLFGKIIKVPVVMPYHLNNLVSALPPTHRYTVDRLIDEHTLLPFYSPFLLKTKVYELRQTMASPSRAVTQFRAGVPKNLQFCPACVLQDKEHFGECYWHRLHQVPGVKICPVHHLWLQSSHVSITHQECVSAEKALFAVELQPLSDADSLPPIFLQIAHDATWLLAQQNLVVDRSFIEKRYVELSVIAKITNFRGDNLFYELSQLFEQTYPVDCLKLLFGEGDEYPHINWIWVAIKSCKHYQHPLHHLLLIHLLGCTVRDFFCPDDCASPLRTSQQFNNSLNLFVSRRL